MASVQTFICAMVKVVAFFWGMGDRAPAFNIRMAGYIYINPYCWVDEFIQFIPYYMEILGF